MTEETSNEVASESIDSGVVENESDNSASTEGKTPERFADIIKAAKAGEAKNDSEEVDAASAEVEKQAYIPNTKIKVYDKEYDIPEAYKSLMKDEASEKEVRELFNKAYGLDGMKPKYQKLQENYQTTTQEFGQLKGEISKLSKYVQLKDYDSFFEALQIPEETLRDWMYEKLKRSQLPADQKAVYDREQALRREYYNQDDQRQKLESDLATRNQQFSEVQTRELQIKLNEAISKPDVASLAKEVDARLGDNAFLNEVIEIGSKRFEQTGQITPPEEIVAELAGRYGKFISSPPNVQGANRGSATMAAQKSNPVIPNTGSGSSSPVKQKINRISDIKKYAETLSG